MPDPILTEVQITTPDLLPEVDSEAMIPAIRFMFADGTSVAVKNGTAVAALMLSILQATSDDLESIDGDPPHAATGLFVTEAKVKAYIDKSAGPQIMSGYTIKARNIETSGAPQNVEIVDFRAMIGTKVAVLEDGALIDTNAGTADSFRVTLAGNRTLDNPHGMIDGQVLTYRIKQDGTGSRTLAYASKFKFSGGTAPTLSTGAGKSDKLVCQYDATADTFFCDFVPDYR